LRGLFTGEAAPVAPIDAPAFRRGVLARLWHDGRFGNLSTDGHRVFGLEHLQFVLPGDYQRLVIDEAGERRFDAGASQAANVLTAYDIATGKLLWQAGGPNWHPQLAAFRSAARLPVETDVDPSAPAAAHPARFDGVQFLGPPLPVADRLFVMADARGATYLLELKADDGSLQSSLMLAAREPLRHYSVETDDMVEDDWPLKGCGGCVLADDLLVCHTGMGQFFGVDLATRAFRWAFPLTELEPEPDENDEGYIEPEFLIGMQRLPENQWLDCGAVVIDDRVLLTSPGRQSLDCLRLRDGELLWSAPRRDGLGIGGVQRGRVLLVDRGGLRCVRLADGKSAWPFERLALPDDTLPAGRGYISGGAFYLPLQPAAVLAVDIANGRWLRRHRGGASAPSGNLLAHGGGVLLQTVDGLFRCASLSESQRASLSALQDRPDDPDLLAQLGQVCTAAGEWSAAIAALRRAHELDPSANRQRQLAESLVDALRSDCEPFHLLAGEIGATLDSIHAELLRRETAMGLERAGRWQAAFAAYQSLAEGASSQAMDRVEAIRQVRRDRWLSARLAEVYAAAADADRVEFDRRVQAVWRDDERAADRHVQLVVYGWHRSSAAVRMELAVQAVTAGQPHRAEWHLAVAGEAGDDAVRRRATEQLARLQPPPAAEAWKGKAAKSSDSKNPHVQTRYPIAVRGDALGATPLFISYDGSDCLEGRDADGRRRWRVELPMAVDGGYFYGGHSGWTAWRLGRIVVVDLGGRVCAVDAAQADGAPLWCRQPELTDATAIDASEDVFADPEAPPELPGGVPLRVALSRSAACFQIGARLWAVDPLSGETLWTRDDLPAGCDLFGDDEALLVTPPDGETTIVLSPVDGGELGSCAAPPRDERLWTVGRRVVVWKMGAERMELSLTDPWRQTTVWRRTFDAKAKTALVDGQEAAVLEPSGRLSMVRLGDGRDRAVVDAGPTPNVQHFAVIAGSKRTILMLSTAPSNGPTMWGWTGEEAWQFNISGRVVAFDADGKRLWSTEVSNQSTRRHQPADLPVLVFVANGERKVWGASRPSCRLLCLDARTGETLHEERAKEYRETGTAIAADPDAGRLEISTSLGRVSFSFIDMPAEPPESAADENL
jgi:outer membrane protein assembly factor BamB